jgi:hypothetical protein
MAMDDRNDADAEAEADTMATNANDGVTESWSQDKRQSEKEFTCVKLLLTRMVKNCVNKL